MQSTKKNCRIQSCGQFYIHQGQARGSTHMLLSVVLTAKCWRWVHPPAIPWLQGSETCLSYRLSIGWELQVVTDVVSLDQPQSWAAQTAALRCYWVTWKRSALAVTLRFPTRFNLSQWILTGMGKTASSLGLQHFLGWEIKYWKVKFYVLLHFSLWRLKKNDRSLIYSMARSCDGCFIKVWCSQVNTKQKPFPVASCNPLKGDALLCGGGTNKESVD